MMTADKNGVYPGITLALGVNMFFEVIQMGLSFSVSKDHVYLSRLKGTGINLGYKITIDGKIFLAKQSGAISHLSEPVIVMKGEPFKIKNTEDGKQIVLGDIVFNEGSFFKIEDMQVGYVYIIYPSGDRELSWITGKRLLQLRGKSLNPNMYNDESFIQTKILLHALRKVNKTSNKMKEKESSDYAHLVELIDHEEPTMGTEKSEEINEPF